MFEALNSVLALEGLVPIFLAVLTAGIVYGFAGFGSALIFMPIATAFVSPQMAVASFALLGLGSIFTVLPEAWSKADRPRTLMLVLSAFIGSFLGVYVLKVFDPYLMRWGISILVAATLVMLVFGWRRTMAETRAAMFCVGSATGLVGGATGLLGPVIILFNLSGQYSTEQMRANTLSFLTLFSVLIVPVLWWQGIFTVEAMALGLMMIPVYAVGTLIGRSIFKPSYERIYRSVGYGVIAIAVLVGLPIWG